MAKVGLAKVGFDRVEAHSHGTTPTIREVAHEGDAELSSANAPEAGAHTEEGAPEGDPKSKVESIQVREALQKAKDMSAKPENPRQEAGRSPHERVEEAKARVARLEGALQLLGVDSPDAEPIKVVLEMARGQCRVLPLGNVSILA